MLLTLRRERQRRRARGGANCHLDNCETVAQLGAWLKIIPEHVKEPGIRGAECYILTPFGCAPLRATRRKKERAKLVLAPGACMLHSTALGFPPNSGMTDTAAPAAIASSHGRLKQRLPRNDRHLPLQALSHHQQFWKGCPPTNA